MAADSSPGSHLLADVQGDDRRRADAVLDRAPSVQLLPDDPPLNGGDLPDAAFYVVERGTALLVGQAGGTRRLVVAVAGAGALLVPPCEAEHLTALAPTRLTAVSPQAKDALMRQPAVAAAIASGLIEAVSDREQSLANFARFPYVERVRAKLLQLARGHGKVTRVGRFGVVIDLPLTHEILAEMVGSTRETVTVALRELANEGFVSRDGRFYRLNVAPAELSEGSPASGSAARAPARAEPGR